MSVEIRLVVPEEWRRVRDLRLRALADAPDAFGSSLERERRHGESEWLGWISGWPGATNALFVAEDGDRWVGMAVGSRPEDGADAYLYGMWVEPASRRAGVGARLVEAVLAWVAGTGARAIVLDVTESNRDALGLYKRMGFEETGQWHPLREGSAIQARVLRLGLERS